jgi:hypothetical protein
MPLSAQWCCRFLRERRKSAFTQPLSLVSLLCGWLRGVCKLVGPLPCRTWGSYPAPAGAFLLDCLPHGGYGPDRDVEAPSMATSLVSFLERTRSLASATCAELRKLKVCFGIPLVTPPGRCPGLVLPRVLGEATWFLSESVWLISWGKATGVNTLI